jgi:hypothetical protein
MAKRRLTESDGIALLDDPIQQRLRVAVRRDVVAFLADMLDMSRPDRAAGAMAFNIAQNYPVNTVGARLKAVLLGVGEGQPWADIEALLAALQGRISLDSLAEELLEWVQMLDPAATAELSLNGRLAAEQQARNDALVAEAVARSAAIGAAVDELELQIEEIAASSGGNAAALVAVETLARTTADEALGVRVDTVSARLNGGGDIAQSLAEARAYAYTKAQSDSALAGQATTLRAEFATADGVVNARVTAEATASSNRDTAIGTRVDGVEARLSTGDIAVAIASAMSYAYTKAQADGALATAVSSLRATLEAADTALGVRISNETSASVGRDGALGSRINTVESRLATGDIATALASALSYAYTKAQSDSALASLLSTVRSEFASGDAAIAGRLNTGDIATAIAAASTYAYTKAHSDGALASLLSQVRSEFATADGTVSASVTALAEATATALGGVLAQHVLKVAAVRVDGKKVFASITTAAGADEGQILLQADTLLFVPNGQPNAAPVQFLELGMVNGVLTLRVPAARIGDSTITPGKMSVPNLAAINANLGTITAGTLTFNSSGYMRGGQTDFDTGTGFFVGRSPALGDYALSLRANDGSFLKFSASGGLQIGGATLSSQSGPVAAAGNHYADGFVYNPSDSVGVSAGIELRRNGDIAIYYSTGNGHGANIVETVGKWYVGGAANIGDGFDARFDLDGGQDGTYYFSTAAAIWGQISSTRSAALSRTSGVMNFSHRVTGTYSVRSRSTGLQVSSGAFGISINRESF